MDVYARRQEHTQEETHIYCYRTHALHSIAQHICCCSAVQCSAMQCSSFSLRPHSDFVLTNVRRTLATRKEGFAHHFLPIKKYCTMYATVCYMCVCCSGSVGGHKTDGLRGNHNFEQYFFSLAVYNDGPRLQPINS